MKVSELIADLARAWGLAHHDTDVEVVLLNAVGEEFAASVQVVDYHLRTNTVRISMAAEEDLHGFGEEVPS